MARYERDFMGRVRGMLDRISGYGGEEDDRAPRRMEGGPRRGRPPMPASGPGGEGYFLSPQMARNAAYDTDYDDDGGWDPGRRGGMAQFGSAAAGRGYGGDFRTERGGPDAGEFFANRNRGGGTGYRADYERDVGMRPRGIQAGGYDADFSRGNGTGYAAPHNGLRGGGFRGAREAGARYGTDFGRRMPPRRGG